MPRYILEVPQVHQAITRPLVKHISDVVLENFGFREDTFQLVFNGMNEAILNNNSAISDKDNPIRLNADQRIEINFDEQVANPLEVALLRQEQIPVFSDRDLHIWLKPVYVSCELTINFKLICKDQTTATMWKRRAELQSYRDMSQFITDVDYHYSIPLGFVKQLWMIHTLRERSEVPLNETLGQWFRRCFAKRMTIISDQAGNNIAVAIAEKQSRVQGWYTFGQEVTKVERSGDAGAWEAEFSVTLFYDRADGVVMDYPLVIHNQLIPKEYRDDTPIGHTWGDWDTSRTVSQHDIGMFERTGQEFWLYAKASGIRIPKFDDWIHDVMLPHHANITRILTCVDSNDKQFIIDFDDATMGDYEINAQAIAYMKDCKSYLLSPYDSIFNTSLHEFDNKISYKYLSVDENLMMRSNFDLNMKMMYHVVVDLLLDLSLLSDIGKEILSRHPEVIKDWLATVHPGKDIDLVFRPDGTVNIDDLIDKFKDPNNGSGGNTYPGGVYNGKWGINILNFFGIIAHRDEE